MSKIVLVLAETRDGQLRNVTFEALSAARSIADGGEVAAVLFGTAQADAVAQLARYGADKVYAAEHEQLQSYHPDAYTQAFAQLVREAAPEAILMGHTAIGKDVAPRVAARLGIGLVSDITELSAADGEVHLTRPIYAGKAFQKRAVKDGTLFATVRPNNFAAAEPADGRTAELVRFAPDIKDLRTIVKEVVRKATDGVDLAEAKIVVSGGRGVKSADGFDPLRELADVLGAAVGASRGAYDAGYCDYAMQIGQTGKVVTPELYIACGISGAIQHVAGMSGAKVIVAINKDPEAPIFGIADYGIVGDLFEVVPLLTEQFRKVLNP